MNKPNQILNEFAQHLVQAKEEKDFSLYRGTSGMAFFYARLYKYTQEEQHQNLLFEFMEHAFNHLQQAPKLDHTFCQGAAGTAWTFNFLCTHGFFEDDPDPVLEDLDDVIIQRTFEDIEKKNFDPLHGAAGCLYYLSFRLQNPRIKPQLEQLLRAFINSAQQEPSGLSWTPTTKDNQGKPSIHNFSLSHGNHGILNILVRCLKLGLLPDLMQSAIQKTVDFSLYHAQNNTFPQDIFPSMITENEVNYQQRMAWCYGDLGTSIALHNAAPFYEKSNLNEKTAYIWHRLTAHKSPEDALCSDAGLCHGTAGSAYIFNTLYKKTRNPMLKNLAEQWYKHIDLTPLSNNNQQNALELGYIEGISGTGICLLDFLMPEDTIPWEQSFFIH